VEARKMKETPLVILSLLMLRAGTFPVADSTRIALWHRGQTDRLG